MPVAAAQDCSQHYINSSTVLEFRIKPHTKIFYLVNFMQRSAVITGYYTGTGIGFEFLSGTRDHDIGLCCVEQ